MKALALTAMALGAVGAAQLMTAKPAMAQVEYPYCKQGAQQGYPGNCSFVSFEACRYAAQGAGGNCVANPRYSAWSAGYRAYDYNDAYGYDAD
ncbi:DUF3551 domain-containing protein [Rhodopseudomonas sp. BR0M22]|uniref:DUF3551 domain-containing protein n=2 Tax=unclassified Rhodopseudomonas TaxID=2638247 RepID=UPI0013DF9431|nr:DUF3551 domain-containing protein [Rhodopseudomonas sp. BR0M22]NEW91176.1 DUF3551 domain-containing protein [Rhodopseudomonas sp. BR0M22]